MQLTDFIKSLKNDRSFMENVTHWQEIPPREARYAPFPDDMDGKIRSVLSARGIDKLYVHQRRAVDLASEGRDFVVVTPTASGKTMCYNLPVLNAIIKDKASRALYLFPTKALSSDQVSELYSLIEAMG
ncbi:MAG: DEAD/DEAH box helicase, partial [Clostridia bacterium]|nr:DEAD/DEAH box helicase [Clostridia bacterium]